MWFVSEKRYRELEQKYESALARRRAEAEMECEKAIRDAEEREKMLDSIKKLSEEVVRYKGLYLDELQKRLELAELIKEKEG